MSGVSEYCDGVNHWVMEPTNAFALHIISMYKYKRACPVECEFHHEGGEEDEQTH